MPSIQETLNAYLDKKDASEVLSILQAYNQLHEIDKKRVWLDFNVHNADKSGTINGMEQRNGFKNSITTYYSSLGRGDCNVVKELMTHLIEADDLSDWEEQITSPKDDYSPIMKMLIDVCQKKYEEELNKRNITFVKKEVEIEKSGADVLDETNTFAGMRKYYSGLFDSAEFQRVAKIAFDGKANTAFALVTYPSYLFSGTADKLDVTKWKVVPDAQIKKHNKSIGLAKIKTQLKGEVEKVKKALEDLKQDSKGELAVHKILPEGDVFHMLDSQIRLLKDLNNDIDSLDSTSPEVINALGVDIDGKRHTKKELLDKSEKLVQAYRKDTLYNTFTLTRKEQAIESDLSNVVSALRQQSTAKITIKNLKEEIHKQLQNSPYIATVVDILTGSESAENEVTLAELQDRAKKDGFEIYDLNKKGAVGKLTNALKASVSTGLDAEKKANILLRLHTLSEDDKTLKKYIDDFQEAFVTHFSHQPTQVSYSGIREIMRLADDKMVDLGAFMRADDFPNNNSDPNMTLAGLKKRFVKLPLAIQQVIAGAVDSDDYVLASARMSEVSALIGSRKQDFKSNFENRVDKLNMIANTAVNMTQGDRPEIGVSKEELLSIKEKIGNLYQDLDDLSQVDTEILVGLIRNPIFRVKTILNQSVPIGEEPSRSVKITQELWDAIHEGMPTGWEKRIENDQTKYCENVQERIKVLRSESLKQIESLNIAQSNSPSNVLRQANLDRLSRKEAGLTAPTAVGTLLKSEQLGVSVINDIKPLVSYTERDVENGLDENLDLIDYDIELLKKESDKLAEKWSRIREDCSLRKEFKSAGRWVSSAYITGVISADRERLNSLREKLLDATEASNDAPRQNGAVRRRGRRAGADGEVRRRGRRAGTGNTSDSNSYYDAKLLSFITINLDLLDLEERRQSILEFQGRRYVDYLAAPVKTVSSVVTKADKFRKRVVRKLKGGSYEDRPVELDLEQIVNVFCDTKAGDIKQLDAIISDLRSISELAEYQRAGILDNDTGVDFVEPFAVAEDPTQLNDTLKQIATCIGQRRIDQFGDDPAGKSLEQIGLDRIRNPQLASDPVEDKLIDEYTNLESVKEKSTNLKSAVDASKNNIEKYNDRVIKTLEAFHDKRTLYNHISKYIHVNNHFLYNPADMEELGKARKDLLEAINKYEGLDKNQKNKLKTTLGSFDKASSLVQESQEAIQRIYRDAVQQHNHNDDTLSEHLDEYLSFKLVDDLTEIKNIDDKDILPDLRSTYDKVVNADPLPTPTGKGLLALKDALNVMKGNVDRTDAIIDRAQKQFSRQIQATDVEVRQLLVDDKVAEAKAKITELQKTISEYKEAWKSKTGTLDHLENFFVKDMKAHAQELEELQQLGVRNKAQVKKLKKMIMAKAEQIPENVPRKAAKALRDTVKEIDSTKAIELYNKYGHDKEAMKRGLFGDTIDREWWSLDQSWWPFGKNRTALNRLEKKIDEHYAIPEFKLQDKFYTIKGRAAAGVNIQEKADFKIPAATDNLSSEFLKDVQAAVKKYSEFKQAYVDGGVYLKKADDIQEMYASIKDLPADATDKKRSDLTVIAKNKGFDAQDTHFTVEGCLQLDEVMKRYPGLPAEQLYTIIGRDARYSDLCRLLYINKSGIIPDNPRIRQYHDLRAQAEEMQRLYDAMGHKYNDSVEAMKELNIAIHGDDQTVPSVLGDNESSLDRTRDMFERVTQKDFTHNILERYMLEVGGHATSADYDRRQDKVGDAKTNRGTARQALLAVIGLEEEAGKLKIPNRIIELQMEKIKNDCAVEMGLGGLDAEFEDQIVQELLKDNCSYTGHEEFKELHKQLEGKNEDSETLISVLNQTINTLNAITTLMPMSGTEGSQRKKLEGITEVLKSNLEIIRNQEYEDGSLDKIEINKMDVSIDQIPGFSITQTSETPLVKQIRKCKKVLKRYREAREDWENAKGEVEKHGAKVLTVGRQADKREELEAQLNDVAKAQLDALLTDDIETFMKYGGASGFNQMATDIAGNKSGFKKLSTIDRIMNKVRKTSKKKVGATYLGKQLQERFKEITSKDPYMSKTSAYSDLPPVLRKKLQESEFLRAAFADTARKLVEVSEFSDDEKTLSEQVTDFVIAELNEHENQSLINMIRAEVNECLDSKNTSPTPVLEACLTAIVKQEKPSATGTMSYDDVLQDRLSRCAIAGIPVTRQDLSSLTDKQKADNVEKFPALQAVKDRIQLAKALDLMRTIDMRRPGEVPLLSDYDELLERVERTALYYEECRGKEHVNEAINRDVSKEAANTLQKELADAYDQRAGGDWKKLPSYELTDKLKALGFQIQGQLDTDALPDDVDMSPLVCGQSLKDFIDAENGKVLEGTIDENTNAVAAKKILGKKLDEFINKFEIDGVKAGAMRANLQSFVTSHNNRIDLETALDNALVPSKPLLGRLAGATTKSFERARAIERVECALKGESLTPVHEKFLHLRTLIEQRGGDSDKIIAYTNRLKKIEQDLSDGRNFEDALDTAIKNFNNRGSDGKRPSREVNLNNLEASFNKIKDGPNQSLTNV